MKNKELERKCKNPKCITQIEKYVPQSFTLFDKENNIYHCSYCHGENQFPKL